MISQAFGLSGLEKLWVGGEDWLAETGGNCDEKSTLNSDVVLCHGFFELQI